MNGEFSGAEMQIGGGCSETFKFGNTERREQRNGPDVVNCQHGSVGYADLCASRQSIVASAAATTNAIKLAQIGMAIPFTVTSQPARTRSRCSKAISENTATAMVVNGFISVAPTHCVKAGLRKAGGLQRSASAKWMQPLS